MNYPIIGISPRFSKEEKSGYSFLKVNQDYIKQIINRGAIPLILLPSNGLEAMLSQCDGFLIIGGDDINPTYYGKTNDANLSKGIDPVTDEVDQKIIQYATAHQIPTFGICRGIQAFAAFMGGTLHQDLATEQVSHPIPLEKKHYVTCVNKTPLTNLLPEKFLVNTFHHQAVHHIPEGFIATYQNEGTIEAIEHTQWPIFGVQWHPERYYTAESAIIFDYFMEKVNEYRKKHI
ncbi:MAG: type 1 glutamine amidotransferase [Prevotella sp.]|nr:type 1 glutamine amidotransferase [Staphylococcus sp.]MCM1349929.1 type 1 glutamine amidotransferase [Prevotella sp.]